MIARLAWLPLALLLAGPVPVRSATPRRAPADTLIDVGGQRLHFRVWPGQGDLTVVFQAGGGCSLSCWATAPSRAAEVGLVRVVAYERAGLGQSEVGPLTLTPETELDQLDRGLDALGVGRIVLVGHSYGGLLSLVHAARRPDRVAGLILVDPMNPIFIEAMGLAWLQATVPEVIDPKTAQDTVTWRMQRTIGELFERGKAALPPRVPTIVITAGLPWFGSAAPDRAWRQSHEQLARQAVSGELVVAERSQHDVPGSEPDVIVAALKRMLGRVASAPSLRASEFRKRADPPRFARSFPPPPRPSSRGLILSS
jgi:pimeloyl-ACP methyl ester carboxylesterase